MTMFIRRLFQSTVSVITTFVLMAAPIAAIIYFSQPAEPVQTGIATGYTVWQAIADTDESERVIKQTLATEPIVSLVKRLGD